MKTYGLVVLGVIIFGFTQAQGQAPASSSTPAGSPSVATLQATLQAQQVKIDSLTQNLELTQRELKLTRSEINVDLDKRLWPVYIFVALLAALGISSVPSIINKIREAEKHLVDKMEASLIDKVKIEIAKRIDKFDPTNVAVHIPSSGFEDERRSLERLGFLNIVVYEELDKTCLEGCIIVHFKTDPHKDTRIADKFREFLDEHTPNPEKVGYLIYIPDGTMPTDLRKKFKVIDYATSIVTLGTNVLTVARSLVP